MLAIAVNLGLHCHQVRENLRINSRFELAVLPNSCDSVLVYSCS